MKNSQRISNITDLQAEIARLRLRRYEQEAYLGDQYKLLKEKVDVPFRLFRRVTAYMPGAGMLRDVTSSVRKVAKNKDADWLTRILQFGAPIVLSSTLLRRAGWLKKSMVLLASETAIGQVNQNNISSLVNKVTSFIKPKKKKKKNKSENVLKERPAIVERPILEGEELPRG